MCASLETLTKYCHPSFAMACHVPIFMATKKGLTHHEHRDQTLAHAHPALNSRAIIPLSKGESRNRSSLAFMTRLFAQNLPSHSLCQRPKVCPSIHFIGSIESKAEDRRVYPPPLHACISIVTNGSQLSVRGSASRLGYAGVHKCRDSCPACIS